MNIRYLIVIAVFASWMPKPCLARPTLKHQQGAYQVEVRVDGQPLHTYIHSGQSYIIGKKNRRYTLRVHNRSHRRVEAVVSVDGLDVIDGKRASFSKRGYLVPAYGFVDIDGWRMSDHQVAAFRFAAVSDSYAARTGSARNVGVIGVAIFPERAWQPDYPVYSPPAPSREYEHDMGGSHDAQRAPARSQTHANSPARSAAGNPSDSSEASDGMLLERKRASRGRAVPQERPGLATRFGERRHSYVQSVSFVRHNDQRPAATLGITYNSRKGLLAMGVRLPQPSALRDVYLRKTADPFCEPAGPYAAPPPGWEY